MTHFLNFMVASNCVSGLSLMIPPSMFGRVSCRDPPGASPSSSDSSSSSTGWKFRLLAMDSSRYTSARRVVKAEKTDLLLSDFDLFLLSSPSKLSISTDTKYNEMTGENR